MDNITIAIIFIIIMLILMLLRMPIAFTMGLVGFVGTIYVLSFNAALQMLGTTIFRQFSSFGLAVIPLFVFMGALAFRTGISGRLYDVAYTLVGHLPGGIAGTTILASAAFSAICGSNSATTAAMGKISLPVFKKYNYQPLLYTGTVAGGGSLGIIIPPSVALIVIAVQTEQSIIRLFIASLVPGLILTGLFLLSILILCLRYPELGPRGPKTSLKAKLLSITGLTETFLLFMLVIGGMYAGWFTPNEAGAVGSFGAIVIGLVRRTLSLNALLQAAEDTIRVASMAVLLITTAVLFSRFLTASRLPFFLAEWVSQLPLSPLIVLAVILFIYLVGGCIMDGLGFLVASIPITFPVALALGYDPVWFTVILTLVTSIGAITPPVGINVYIVSSFAPDVPIQTVFKGAFIFLIAYFVIIVMVIFFPQLALFLPNMLM
ncbi:MAG: TRAP transporter large permease [Bacillota bacterium]